MNTNKFYATMAIPVLLFLLSYLQRNALGTEVYTSTTTSILEGPGYLEVPDYVYSTEYRMIIEKTYLDLFDSGITDSMHLERTKWLGHCNEDGETGDCATDSRTGKRCGDKIQWGGEIFCIEW